MPSAGTIKNAERRHDQAAFECKERFRCADFSPCCAISFASDFTAGSA
jgi:hypothetical protein